MNAPAMHSQAAPAVEPACETCRATFQPKRGWARFCSAQCRNAFHGAEKRRKAIERAGVPMYEVLREVRDLIRGKDLEHVWMNYPTEPAETLGQRIDKVIGKLKPPAEPKALLEKAKA
jgi:hypothetical protein